MGGYKMNAQETKDVKPITMTKEKEFLIFNRKGYDFCIKYNLNTGEFIKCTKATSKPVKAINAFFANVHWRDIIDYDTFPIYAQMINMAAHRGYRLTNMGSVLEFLRQYKNWEQYMVLDIPFSPNVSFSLGYFPKDVLKVILRAIRLSDTYKDICNKWWRARDYGDIYYLPTQISPEMHFYGADERQTFFNCVRYAGTFADDKEFMEIYSFIDRGIADIQRLCNQYQYEYKALFRYLIFVRHYEGYDSYYDELNDLADYAHMSNSISEECGKNGKFEKYPHFLKSRHMIATRNYKCIEDEIKFKEFKKCYNGSLAYKGKAYSIVEPTELGDVLAEAQAMHNCVASYVDRIIAGTTHIVFMRANTNLDESLVTVEVKKGHICQAYQMNNVSITKEQNDFLAEYAKNKNFILDNL